MKLRVTYKRPQDFVADYDGQFTRGGLLVRVTRVNPAPASALELEMVQAARAAGTMAGGADPIHEVVGNASAAAESAPALPPEASTQTPKLAAEPVKRNKSPPARQSRAAAGQGLLDARTRV